MFKKCINVVNYFYFSQICENISYIAPARYFTRDNSGIHRVQDGIILITN